MIHVQIASQVTATGVDGVRWVLVEAGSAPTNATLAPAVTLAAATARTPARDAGMRQQLSLTLLKTAVLGLALGLALWAAQTWLGPNTVPWLAPAATPSANPPPAYRPGMVAPMPLPLPNAPSASAPLITAELK